MDFGLRDSDIGKRIGRRRRRGTARRSDRPYGHRERCRPFPARRRGAVPSSRAARPGLAEGLLPEDGSRPDTFEPRPTHSSRTRRRQRTGDRGLFPPAAHQDGSAPIPKGREGPNQMPGFGLTHQQRRTVGPRSQKHIPPRGLSIRTNDIRPDGRTFVDLTFLLPGTELR